MISAAAAALIASKVRSSPIACAIAAQAEAIVSGDADLLSLKAHQGIRIVSATEALQLIRQP